VYFVQCDDEDAEVDVEIIEKVLPDKSLLIMKVDEMPDTENQMPGNKKLQLSSNSLQQIYLENR
jgi:hypothetical protein